ncbi:alpha/beta fold hydrolase [Amycolatopsis methanolica]|uniref:Putative hydrolase n=1 Tax=Amycolatopsis methanolica 239 TaxID=1068978 RepID=A0A076MKL9_AMYME|nr:alpha/beta hydrolase [Amycolatopsis methanolica]AIJ21284.1 putative hydrolase [Amycolatopsis methanolica 239]
MNEHVDVGAHSAAPPIQRSQRFRGDTGAPVCAHDFGGTGDLLIIAHAAGFCGGAYAPIAATLRTHFRVWAVDLRGHGDSEAPPDADFSWDGMAQDILTVLTGLGRGPAAFFGHSLGGGAGLRAEALAPGSFSSIYVYEPAVLPVLAGVQAASDGMSNMVRQRRAVFESREQAVRRLSSRPPFDTMRGDALESFARHGLRDTDESTVALKCSPENEALVYGAPRKITVEQISAVSVPVLVGLGERENGLPAVAAPLIRDALPDARIVSYRGLGHMGPFEDPSSVGADAAGHLAGRTGRIGRA